MSLQNSSFDSAAHCAELLLNLSECKAVESSRLERKCRVHLRIREVVKKRSLDTHGQACGTLPEY